MHTFIYPCNEDISLYRTLKGVNSRGDSTLVHTVLISWKLLRAADSYFKLEMIYGSLNPTQLNHEITCYYCGI